ncbi:unnamed protein product, partial [marine sediment metagenome]
HVYHRLQGVDDRTKFELMRHAALVLAPSDFEGFGMVPSEALSAGTPCLVYDLPVLRQEYGDALVYTPRGDAKAFIAKAHALLDAPPKVPEVIQQQMVNSLGMGAMVEAVDRLPYHHSKRPHISVLMNAYACATVVPFALEAIYPHVDEIIIAYGREATWEWPADNTLDVIRNYPDPDCKIKTIAQDVWPGETGEKSRSAMRRAATAFVTGNYLMILDADEIWTGFEHYVAALREGKIAGGCPLALTFWHDLKHHIISSALERWGLRSPYTKWGVVWPHV